MVGAGAGAAAARVSGAVFAGPDDGVEDEDDEDEDDEDEDAGNLAGLEVKPKALAGLLEVFAAAFDSRKIS